MSEKHKNYSVFPPFWCFQCFFSKNELFLCQTVFLNHIKGGQLPDDARPPQPRGPRHGWHLGGEEAPTAKHGGLARDIQRELGSKM